MNARTVAIGCRCQLLTGSYEGASRSCDCKSLSDCYISEEARKELAQHDKVKRAKARNWTEHLGYERTHKI